MKEVDVDADTIAWPQKCCRCGSKSFSIKEHMAKCVIWSTGAITRYDLVLLNIPVCGSCAAANKVWLGAAAVFGLVCFAGLYLGKESLGFFLFWAILAIVTALIGENRKPIKVLRLDKARNRLRIRIYNDGVAAALMQKK